MLYLSGISLSIFLFLVLISKKGKTLSDKILAVWIALIGLNLFHYYLSISDTDSKHPLLLALGTPLPLLHGPLLFLYTSSLTDQFPQKRLQALFHFIPIAIIYLIFIPFYFLDHHQQTEVFLQHGKGFEIPILINLTLIYFSGIFYVIGALLLLKKHRKNILEQFSDIEKINLNWLRYLIIGLSSIWIFVFYGHDDLIYGSVVLFVAFIGYYGIRQVGIFTSRQSNKQGVDELIVLNRINFLNPTDPDTDKNSIKSGSDKAVPSIDETEAPHLNNQNQLANLGADHSINLPISEEKKNTDGNIEESPLIIATKKKYQKSGLSESEALSIHQRLTQLMTSEKTYKNPELTLVELAQTLNIHPNILSQVINTLENKNFYDYVNDKRIEEFKTIVVLPQNKKYTLLSLALACGFNSKTTFNRNFKKSSGMSPSEYLKRMNIQIKN